MNRRLLEEDIQAYIRANRERSPSTVALGKSPFIDVSSSEIASQIDGWQRSVRKLPTWAYSAGIYYPNKINLEQCSSEHTALVKQTLIHKGAGVIDLTGGFGVDSCYMAQEAAEVVHCELDTHLSEIVQHNANVLGVRNMRCIAGDGINYLRAAPDNSVDYIYIDPSRRSDSSRVFLLKDCEPNILVLQDLFFSKSTYILTKLSPLLDISHVLSSLRHIHTLYVISLDNDCKELVVMQQKGFQGETSIRAIRLFRDQLHELTFTMGEERMAVPRYSLPEKYLYEPDVSITKAGAFKTVAKRYGLAKLHQHSHLYTSAMLQADFPGRIFCITEVLPFGTFKKNKKWEKANITIRNFPSKVDVLRKRFKIKDGGDVYLFFTTNSDSDLIVIVCKKI